jgi:hypothetical protein
MHAAFLMLVRIHLSHALALHNMYISMTHTPAADVVPACQPYMYMCLV